MRLTFSSDMVTGSVSSCFYFIVMVKFAYLTLLGKLVAITTAFGITNKCLLLSPKLQVIFVSNFGFHFILFHTFQIYSLKHTFQDHQLNLIPSTIKVSRSFQLHKSSFSLVAKANSLIYFRPMSVNCFSVDCSIFPDDRNNTKRLVMIRSSFFSCVC